MIETLESNRRMYRIQCKNAARFGARAAVPAFIGRAVSDALMRAVEVVPSSESVQMLLNSVWPGKDKRQALPELQRFEIPFDFAIERTISRFTFDGINANEYPHSV